MFIACGAVESMLAAIQPLPSGHTQPLRSLPLASDSTVSEQAFLATCSPTVTSHWEAISPEEAGQKNGWHESGNVGER